MRRVAGHPLQLAAAMRRLEMRKRPTDPSELIDALRGLAKRRRTPAATLFEEKLGLRLSPERRRKLVFWAAQTLETGPTGARRLAVLGRLCAPPGEGTSWDVLAGKYRVTTNAIRQDEALALRRLEEGAQIARLDYPRLRPDILCRGASQVPNVLGEKLEKEPWYRRHRDRLAPAVEGAVARVRATIDAHAKPDHDTGHPPEVLLRAGRLRKWVLDAYFLAEKPVTRSEIVRRCGGAYQNHVYWVYGQVVAELQRLLPPEPPSGGPNGHAGVPRRFDRRPG